MNGFENAKIIVEFISSLFILIGVIYAWIKGIAYFNYKTDSTIRDLYITNAQKVDKIFGYHFSHSILDEEHRKLLYQTYREAALYLHKDILEFIEKLRTLLINLEAKSSELDGLPKGEERTNICKNILSTKQDIDKLSKDFYQIYRDKIVQDGIKTRTKEFWEEKVCKK